MNILRQAFLALFAASSLVAMAPSAAQEPTLYQKLGNQAGIERIVDTFVGNLLIDPRIKDQFAKTDIPTLKKRLAEQFCVLSAGPCRYTGADMKSAHSNLDITKANFNALVEDLQLAMDKENVPFTTQNRLLALLAPMHRDVITVP